MLITHLRQQCPSFGATTLLVQAYASLHRSKSQTVQWVLLSVKYAQDRTVPLHHSVVRW